MLQSNVSIAKEQLSYAAGLYFSRSEISVVATLTFSAYGILIDLLKGRDCFRDWMQKDHPQITSKKMWKMWNDTWGFLKHGKGGIEEREIDPNLVELILFTAICDFQALPKIFNIYDMPRSSIEMEVYQLWFCAKNEDTFSCEHESIFIAKNLFSDILRLDKMDQIELGERVLTEQKHLLDVGK